MADAILGSSEEKLNYFQDVTGVQDRALCKQILEAHSWDLDAAVSAMLMDTPHPPSHPHAAAASPSFPHHPSPTTADPSNGPTAVASSSRLESSLYASSPPRFHNGSDVPPLLRNSPEDPNPNPNPNPAMLVWKIVTLPFSIVRGSFNVAYSAVGLGMWVVGGVLSYSLGALGWPSVRIAAQNSLAPPLPVGAVESVAFVSEFEREYGEFHPNFQTTTFIDALRRATTEYKFLFVYLHSPEHADSPPFCERTLCLEAVVRFLDENFVCWAADVRSTEGFQMSNSLRASTFPFCAVVMSSSMQPSNQRIALLQQVEGLKSSSELLAILQRVIEDQGSILAAARADHEERALNRRLREEQDAAYRAALLADQEREQRRQEEAEQAAREMAEAERKVKEEQEARAEAAKAAAEREAALERRRQEKAMSLGLEPEKGPNTTHVVVRFPNGERKERRFDCSSRVQSVYDFVDSLGSLDVLKYSLVSNFPRIVYNEGKLNLSLKEAGLHPHASLFVQVEEG